MMKRRMAAPTPASWPRQDLLRRVAAALNIGRRTIDTLGLDGYREAVPTEDSFGPDKPLAETAMLLYVVDAIDAATRKVLRHGELGLALAPLARSPRTALAIALHPTICFQLAMPHILLTRLGLEDPHFDRGLALSAASMASRGREFLPHRTLESCWLRSLWSGTPPGPTFDRVAAHSVLGHPLDLFWGSRDDAYAYTHTCMYFTDFGRHPRPLPRTRVELVAESTALLLRSLLMEDFDLAAEVLMTWPLLAADWTPAAAFGFRVLAELEDRTGYLPAGNGIPGKFHHLAGAERTRYALAAAYHTAYVMGMLCALVAGPGRSPPPAIAGPPAPASLIETLSNMLPVTDTPWQITFRNLQPTEQRALAPALLHLALQAKIRRHDLAGTAGLLDIAARYGMADTPVCAQAAELLQRMAVCAAR